MGINLMFKVVEIVKLSNSIVSFFSDFKSEEETQHAKNLTFLVLDICHQNVVTLGDDGSIVHFTKHDLQSVKEVSVESQPAKV